MDNASSRVRSCAAVAAACALLIAATRPSAPDTFDATRFLREYAGFSTGDLESVSRGDAVARSLDADASEVALATAIRVRIPAAFYVQRFREIESFKRSEQVLQVGRFDRTPSAGDVQRLDVPPGDVEDLRKCRPGDCDVKLDEAGITRIAVQARRGVPAAAADALRQHLAGYAARYWREGNAALMTYADRLQPTRISEELALILQRSEYLQRELPILYQSVGAFAGTLPSAAEHFLYWSNEKAGPKPVISITHATIARASSGVTGISTKQIYASHYFNASLGVTLLVETDADGAAPQTMLIYVNRSRLDVFGGILGPVRRTIVRARARGGAESMLRQLAQRLEREFIASRDPSAPRAQR